MKILCFQMNMIICQSKASTEKRNTVFTITILWHIANNNFPFQSNTCAFLTKAFHELLSFQKNLIIFQSKASTEKIKTVLTSSYTLTYAQQRLIFAEKVMCISYKSVSWRSYTFKRTWLSFKVKILQRKGAHFSLLTILWHIPNNGFYFSEKDMCVSHKGISWNYTI